MTQLKVDTITDAAGTAAPDLADGLTVNGAALSTVNTAEYYSSGTEPSSPKNGAIWWDTANDKVMIYVNDAWSEVSLGASASSAAWYGDRGLIAGGEAAAGTLFNNIDYFDITTTSNASDFGDLTVAGQYGGNGASDASRALFASGDGRGNVIDYVTVSTTGNATDFGDRTVSGNSGSAMSDATYAVFGTQATNSNVLDYVTIQTTGNATDFGDTTIIGQVSATWSDSTYGVMMNRQNQDADDTTNNIDYITIASTGNATDFGDLTQRRHSAVGGGDTTRAVCAGGTSLSYSDYNIIDYITTATTGNATDFGDLLAASRDLGSACNSTKVTFSGSSGHSNQISFITTQTTGNAADFGDMTYTARRTRGVSGAAS